MTLVLLFLALIASSAAGTTLPETATGTCSPVTGCVHAPGSRSDAVHPLERHAIQRLEAHPGVQNAQTQLAQTTGIKVQLRTTGSSCPRGGTLSISRGGTTIRRQKLEAVATITLPPGSYQFTAVCRGFKTWTERTELSVLGGDVSIGILLQPAPPPPPPANEKTAGTLQIDGLLPGAKVRLLPSTISREVNGPALTLTVPPGPYHLEVALDAYQPFTQDVEVAAGRTISVRVQLILKNGSLELTGTPSDAAITLQPPGGSAPLSGKLPFVLDAAAPGDYQVLASAPGFADLQVTVTVTAGQRQPEHLVLKQLGKLEVEGSPRGAGVAVTSLPQTGAALTGASRSGTTAGVLPWKSPGLQPGRYQLEVTARSYAPFRTEVQVALEKTHPVRVKLERSLEFRWGVGLMAAGAALTAGSYAIAGPVKAARAEYDDLLNAPQEEFDQKYLTANTLHLVQYGARFAGIASVLAGGGLMVHLKFR